MKNQLFLSIMLMFFFNVGFSQGLVDKSADNGLMVRQIPDTESAAIKFFSRLTSDSDTIYATIFRPANCPRCDGFLNKIYSLTKSETEKPAGLIAVYPDSTAAQAYIEKYNLLSDFVIYDTDEKFSEFLSFSPGYLHVGYILKFNKATGELIIGSNADNVSVPFFKELNIYSKRKDTHKFDGTDKKYHNWETEKGMPMSLANSYPILLEDSTYKISEILYQPVFHHDKLLFNDKLAMAVVEFDLTDSEMTMKRLVEPNSDESRRFVDLPDALYQKLLRANQLKNIPLQSFIIDDNTYGIAYSLPELWLSENNELNYRNKPCFIEKSFTDKSYSRLIPLEYDYEDVFYYPHFNMKWYGDGKVAVGVQRITWPMITDTKEYAHIPEMNPFEDEFYQNYEQPTLATFNISDGHLSSRFGKLPNFANKTKTGYCFSDMVIDSWNNEIIYGSAYDGIITIAPADFPDCADCRHTYKAFDLDESIFIEPDSSRYYSYSCNMLAEPFLSRKIMDLKIDENNIYCLLRNCTDAFERPELEDYEFIVISRDSGEIRDMDFPHVMSGERRIAYGLRRNRDGSVSPYIIRNISGGWEVAMMAPSDDMAVSHISHFP